MNWKRRIAELVLNWVGFEAKVTVERERFSTMHKTFIEESPRTQTISWGEEYKAIVFAGDERAEVFRVTITATPMS